MWTVIAVLILVGLVLLLLEILVIPGTGITGVFGFALMVAGVWLAYTKKGATEGYITLIITILVSTVVLLLALRSKTWKKAQLKTFISGKVRTLEEMDLKPGMRGETISRCAPIGKAVFGNKYVEVDSGTVFLGTGTPVEIVRISGNKIFIKQIII